jgi:glutamate/tyrosine decarboxylase-like PLP-dependent enzyme
LLAAATNTPSGAFSYMSSNYVEDQVPDWFKVMLGFPEESSGIITSGCSASNLIGLAVARNARAGYDLRQKGLRSAPKEMTIYAST